MKESIEMPRGIFYIIVGLCAAIIMFISLDMILRTKDMELFNIWAASPNISSKMAGQTVDETYATYIQMNLSMFIVRVVTPMAVALHSYYTLVKLRVNKLFVILWIVIIIGSFALSTLGEAYYSIFFVLTGIAYLGLIGTLLYLGKSINNIRGL